MTNQFPDATKKVLSPATQAVLTAVTQQEYCLDPSEIPTEAARIGYLLSAALLAAAEQVVPEEPLYGGDQRWMFERDARQACRKQLLAIAAELEGKQ